MTPSLSGRLADFDLPQIICLVEAAHITGTLVVSTTAEAATLHFRKGELVAARAGELRADLAIYETLAWEEGEFRLRRCDPAELPEREINRSSQGLCLEAMRLVDESQTADLAFAPVAGVHTEQLDQLSRSVLAVLGEEQTLGSIARAVRLSPPVALSILEELEQQRLVRRCEAGPEGGTAVNGSTPRRVRVLLVDDSKLMQRVLCRLYESDPGIEVVGIAEHGEQALRMLPEAQPDVVSLDLYMPVMDGVNTLKRIMLSQPTPTVIVTSASPEDLDLTFESILRFGAIDFITKPAKRRGELGMQAERILSRIHKAARVNLRGIRMVQPPPRPARRRMARAECRGLLVALAGTGGCLSFMQMIASLPTDLPLAVVGSLGFPREFLKAFVHYLDKSSAFEVQLAADGVPLDGGVCYLASEGECLALERRAGGVVLRVHGEPDPGRAGGSGLLAEAAGEFGERAVGLLLSGEGEEALNGLAALRAAGGVTMAQLPETCVDPEQPRRAIELRLIDRTVLLSNIAGELSQALMSRLRRSRREQSVTDTEREAEWPRKSA